MQLDEFPFDQVAQWMREGRIVPFLGAGASIAGLPNSDAPPDGRRLADALRTGMGAAYPGAAGDALTKVAQFFELNVFDRPALYDFVRGRFHLQTDAELAAVPRFLATVPGGDSNLYVVTTNYDRQVEMAFEREGRPLCVVTQEIHHPTFGAAKVLVERPGEKPKMELAKKLVLPDGLPPRTAILYKMHGSLSEPDGPRDSLIITEDDYVDFLVHAGGTSTSALVPPPPLATAFRRRRFLFLGYSLEDWNLRVLLRLLALRSAPLGGTDLRSWAIQRRPAPVEEALWFQRKVNLFAGDLVDFCDRMYSSFAGGASSA